VWLLDSLVQQEKTMTVQDTISTQTAISDPASESQPLAVAVDTSIPRAWDGRVAYVASMVFSPPVLSVIVMLLTASVLSGVRAWAWAGIYVFLAVLLPLLYLVWLLHRGLVTDLDVQLREQRIRPLLFTVICAGLAWVVLGLGVAPRQLVAVASALSLMTMIILSITLWWKISVHCAAVALGAAVVWALFGVVLPLVIGAPLMAWARVRLRRHTVAQTIAGLLLGLTVFLLLVPGL
jgi:membrane-associated phospholipid phosphatase